MIALLVFAASELKCDGKGVADSAGGASTGSSSNGALGARRRALLAFLRRLLVGSEEGLPLAPEVSIEQRCGCRSG